PFIFSSWLRGYRQNSLFAKNIPGQIFYKNHHDVVEYLLSNSAQCIIAHTVEDLSLDMPEVLVGFFCFENESQCSIGHFIYTKETFRRMGIARKMIEASAVNLNKLYASHWTYVLDDLGNKMNIQYDPYRI